MIRKGIFLIAMILCVSYSGIAFAFQLPILQRLDTLTARSWMLEDGLPVNTIGHITQDSLGYLWINTYDGLVRFDGLNFKVYDYSNTPEMPHNRTTFVYIQDGTGMWVSFEYGGVLLIDGEEASYFGENEGFTNSDITQLYEASDGSMFFVTHVGLYVYANGQFSLFYEREDKAQNEVHQVFEDEKNSIWVGTNNGLLNFSKDGRLIGEYHISDVPQENRIMSINKSRDEVLTIGTSNGIYELWEGRLVTSARYEVTRGISIPSIYSDSIATLFFSPGRVFIEDGKGSVREIEETNLKLKELYTICYRDMDGLLWLIGSSGTLSTFRNGKFEALKAIEELQDYQYNSVYEDRERNLWFGTSRNGLIKVSKSKVRTLGEHEGLSGSNILALHKDRRERYWIGTRLRGLNVLNGNSITQFSIQDGIASGIVQAIGEDDEGNIWLGYHQKGVDLVTDSGFINYKIGGNVEINDIHAIYTDSKGTMWLGTYGGLVQFDPGKNNQKVFTKEDGLSGVKIRYITEDESGGLWIGSLNGGVSRYSNNTFQNYTLEDGLSSNNIRSIYVDEQDSGTVWVGTENNGLNRLKEGEITYASMDDGLPDHIIHWISQDKSGWLWMSTNRGILKINKDELNKYLDKQATGFTLLHYGRPEGMRNPEGNGAFQEAGLRTTDGYFWFATQEGVAIFESDPAGSNTVPPTVLIEQIEAGGRSYKPDTVSIERGYKNFQIHFHALTFNAPEKTRFRYRLAGYSEDWTEVFGERTVSYVNVSAGKYTFEILAANNDGVWSPEPARASIIVQPFFYEQPWFYAIVLLLLAGGYYGFSQIRYRYLLHQQEKLERIIEEQTAQLRKEKNEIEKKSKIIKKQAVQLKESNETKDKFFSLIAHDLRNPFQVILGYSELLLGNVEEDKHPQLRENLEHIYSSSQTLFKLVENLLDWASLHTGKIKPDPERVNLKQLVERTIRIFEHIANQKQISLYGEVKKEYYIHADLNMLQTVLRNLVSNALKFTPQKGRVSLGVRKDKHFFYIWVEDDGIGMKQKMAEELLHLDANSSRLGTDNERGTGLGLLICKEMIEMHHGKIMVESKESEGTTFTIKLPIEGLPVPKFDQKNLSAD